MLLDSNILIYFSKSSEPIDKLEPFFTENTAISAISKLEVLGFHALAAEEKQILETTLENMWVIPVSQEIIDRGITLRQQKSMSVGDAIIAATALEHDLTLVTRNVNDFNWIDGLKLVNPFEG